MSLGTCVPDLLESGKLRPAKADQLRDYYEGRLAEYRRDMGEAAAEVAASDDALKWLSAETRESGRQKLLAMKAQSSWLTELKQAADERGVLPVAVALRRMARIDKQADALRGRFFSTVDKLLSDHRRNVFGVMRNKADLELIGRARFGESVDDLNARELADAMGEALELARTRHNQAGGHIGKMDDYGLPQSHDARLVRKVDFDTWRDFGPNQRVRVLDLETGKEATGLRRETLLREIYETIRSDGANRMSPGAVGQGSLANRRADPRVLHYASFDDWMEYQTRFGGGDNIYDIFGQHLHSMARDIALMEGLGPNPAATLRWLKDSIEQSVDMRGTQAQIDVKQRGSGKLQRLYDELTGSNRVPESRRLALIGSGLRSQQVSAKLGSAVLSVLPDFATMLGTARFNRVPMMRTIANYVKLWNPLDDGDRRLAVRLGLVVDDWIGLTSSAHRYLGEELQGEVARRMADFVIRSQGLSRHTRNGQWATGMNFVATFTHNAVHAFNNLPAPMQRQMRKYGIGEREWDAYRTTRPRIERGADWIVPLDMEDQRIGDRFMELILTETDHAVIVPDVNTRTFINSWAKPGTWVGEILRSSLLFKSFPLAIINLHGRRMIEQPGLTGKLGYAVPMGLAMVGLGALSAQLKTIAAGKDPQPMLDNPKFWGRAVVQSGGLGLFGDLLFNSENSYGGGMLQTLAGPVLGQTVPNLADATFGNALRAAGVGEGDPEFGKDLWNTLEKEVPGRNLVYSRLVWENILSAYVDRLANPDIESSYRQMQRRAENEGTQYWWEPGQVTPARSIYFENATEGAIPE